MNVDPRFREYFDGRLKQVFLYITDRCNLKCNHCLYKPSRSFSFGRSDMPLESVRRLLGAFQKLGATKATLLGGEPTLHPKFHDIAKHARDIGYQQVRIDTNGQYPSRFLADGLFRHFDEMTFSLDGHTEEMNDSMRGRGTYRRAVARIRDAASAGMTVQTTTCLHRLFAEGSSEDDRATDLIDHFLSLGVKRVNFHSLVRTSVPRDAWSGTTHMTAAEHVAVRQQLETYKTRLGREVSSRIRVPMGFVTAEEFRSNREYYSYCSVKNADRLLVSADQTLRICSLLLCSPYYVGYYDERGVFWNRTPTNEVRHHSMSSATPCTNQSRMTGETSLVPLCVSFKPGQAEHAWHRLGWDAFSRNAP